MAQTDARLADLLSPIRAQGAVALLDAIARTLETGAEVEAEPVLRDADGRVRREGPLALPRRADLMVARDGQTLPACTETEAALALMPDTLHYPGGFRVVIASFRWDAAEILIETRDGAPDWQPIRQWFLEWFQSRHADVAPELAGAVHALEGPRAGLDGWRLTVDFGSAPVAALTALIAAASETGARRMRLGEPG